MTFAKLWAWNVGYFCLAVGNLGRHGGLMVSALVPGASGPGSSPDWEQDT